MGETTQCRMSKIRAVDMRVAVMMGVEDVADSTSPMAESRRRQRGCRARVKRKRKMSQIARKEEEQMWNMLRNVSIVIGFIFFMFAVYAFSKKGSLSTPESYTGYDGSAI